MALMMGSIYCLVSIGITLIYGVMRVVNWANGAFYTMGAYVQYFLIVLVLGQEYWLLAIPLSMLVAGLAGMLTQRLLLGGERWKAGGIEQGVAYATLITLGVSIVFQNWVLLAAGPTVWRPSDYLPLLQFSSFTVSGNRVVACIGAMIALGVLHVFLSRTWPGRAFNATAQNRIGAQIAGINVGRMDTLAFGISTALAGLAGGLLAPVLTVHPQVGAEVVMKAYVIVVLGGLGSILGTIVGGLLLGFVEILGSMYISPQYRDLYGMVLLVVVLIIRPYGLFGKAERRA